MTLQVTNQILQLAAWLLAVLEFVLALYVLLLNPRHPANQHACGLFVLVAADSLAIGLMLDTGSMARLGPILHAAAPSAMMPAMLLTTAAIFRPDWLPARGRGLRTQLWWLAYVLGAVPIILTAIDVAVGTRLWYVPPPADYNGGFLSAVVLAAGSVARVVRPLNMYVVGLGAAAILVLVLVRRQGAIRLERRLAGLLLAAQFVAPLALMLLTGPIAGPMGGMLAGGVYCLVYAFATFAQMTSEHRIAGGRLQTRLVALVLAVAAPVFIVIVAVVNSQAATALEASAQSQLHLANQGLGGHLTIWLDMNARALQEMVSLPDIASMDPAQQRPILQAMAAAHPYMYLVSTTDTAGMNIARNDDVELMDYRDRAWYQGAVGGEPIVLQTLIGRTTNQPALVMAMPIKNAAGHIVGVGMFAAHLTAIGTQVQATTVGRTGYAFVIDAANQVVAHPDPTFTSKLQDMSEYPPVKALRAGTRGALAFRDDQGKSWRADVQMIDRNWGVVVQEPEAELLAELRSRQQVSWGLLAGGALILLVLTWLSIRQALRPVGALTDTATAIAAGDLARSAPVQGTDEIGRLAHAFNTMTQQLRSLIATLEQRVADRTADLERRSRYLQASAQVGQAVTSMLDVKELSSQVAELIRDRFGLYYVGLFLLEEDPQGRRPGGRRGEQGQWAVLQTGTGEAGQAMVRRGHRIRVGQGMIGWSIAHAEARVAMEVGADAVRLATPELPETRSEAALPLRSRGRVLGAVTVQSVHPGAFDRDTITVLQTMADQVAVALDNAQLFAESQDALDAARRAYGEVSREAWRELIQSRAEQGYRYSRETISPTGAGWQAEMTEAVRTGQIVPGSDGREVTLSIPLLVREQVVGVLTCRKEGKAWSDEEMDLLTSLVDQATAALESARLFQDTQRRAAQEQILGQVTSRIRETLDIETVLKTAVQEVRQALGVPEVTVRLVPPPGDGGAPGNGRESGA